MDNELARTEVRSKGHMWLHLPLDSDHSDVVQHVYAGRVMMESCRKHGRLCVVFLNDKGASKKCAMSVLRSTAQNQHEVILRTSGQETWGKCQHIVAPSHVASLVACPFEYRDSNSDSRLVSTLPVIRELGLLQDVLGFMKLGMTSQRRQVGIDDLRERLHGVTRSTYMYKSDLKVIHAFASLRVDPQPYLSVSVNQGFVGWHVDRNNSILRSDTISFGVYQGGFLETDGKKICTRHTWTRFDVHSPHQVQGVSKGTRWSVSLYSPKRTSGLTQRDMRQLRLLGFSVSSFMNVVSALPVDSAPKRRKGQGGEFFYSWNSDDDGDGNDDAQADMNHPELTEF
eukprot:4401829-Amphidinium_carterae.1